MEHLSDIEARILACLVEKQLTTPDLYPLTLNSLTLACNQKSNREPVVAYEDRIVLRGLDGLREKKLVWMVHHAGSRVPKYEHRLAEMLPLPADQLAVLCLLMLRGPQTAGELRNRSGRLHLFATVVEVEVALQQLAARADGALVMQLPLLPGTREPRHVHLLCGPPAEEMLAPPPPVETLRAEIQAEDERFRAMEADIAALKEKVAALEATLEAFRSQFE